MLKTRTVDILVANSHLTPQHLSAPYFPNSSLSLPHLLSSFSPTIAFLESCHPENFDFLNSSSSYFRISSEPAGQAFAMATMAPMHRPTRQPLGAVSGTRLRNLGQVKNKQNGEDIRVCSFIRRDFESSTCLARSIHPTNTIELKITATRELI